MRNHLIIACVLVFGVALSTALICRECANAISDAHCEEIGIDRECPLGEADQCQIQIRYHEGWGPGYRIFKNCKQGRACDNNYIQNPREAWLPTQCIPTFANSVCRCCCDTDRCNVAQETCFRQSQRMQCSLPPSSVFMGSISCTNGRELGSQCTTTCAGSASVRRGWPSTTYCRYDGAWSHPFGQCARATCLSLRLVNGWYAYSDTHLVGSIASAQCNHGFDLRGPPALRCTATTMGARWNLPGPVCVRRQCPDISIAGANITCENGRYTQSHCEVSCGDEARVIGVRNFYCQDNGIWSHKLPTCERISCQDRGTVVNGRVDCNNGKELFSDCQVICDEGFEADGMPFSQCVVGVEPGTAVWNLPLSTCIRSACPPRGTTPFGTVNCDNEDNVGSICSVLCDEGYTSFDESISTCTADGVWDNPLPSCESTTCDNRGIVDFGVVRCTSNNDHGSRCNVICDRGYVVAGEDESVCLTTSLWDYALPRCVPAPCKPQGNLRHGDIDCDGNEIGDSCQFTCRGEYTLFPEDMFNNTCLSGGEWNRPKPCCTRSCPPYALMDLVVVMDSSSSVGAENWVLLTNFVASFLNAFEVSRTAAHYGIFRYNRDVDADTEIFLKDFPTDKEGFLAKFREIPYDGSGTNTGAALAYAYEKHLTAEAGNRPDVQDVVLLLTDGKSNDAVAPPAQMLRDMGALVFALGIEPPRGRLDEGELLAIAGDPDRVIIPEGGFAGLGQEFTLQLASHICGGGCGRT